MKQSILILALLSLFVSCGTQTAKTNPCLHKQAVVEYGTSRVKMLIAEKLGIDCETFVCPFGITQNRVAHKATKENLLKCNYEMAFLGRFGACKRDSQVFDLPRITIYGGDNIDVFRSKVDGRYDWLEYPLMLFKVLRYHFMSVFGTSKV
jgi:hypothetical protein